MKDYNLINQRATTCKHGGHCEWIACDKCSHYEPDVLNQQPCEDCISRQAVNEGFKKYASSSFAYGCVWDYINKLPSVTPKEKTGHWIQQPRCEGDEQPDLVCPNCGFKISWWDMGNFCAKCGTGLEGGAG